MMEANSIMRRVPRVPSRKLLIQGAAIAVQAVGSSEGDTARCKHGHVSLNLDRPSYQTDGQTNLSPEHADVCEERTHEAHLSPTLC